MQSTDILVQREPQLSSTDALSPAGESVLDDRVVEWVRERRLELPVSLFLEMHLPLTTVVHTSALLLQPVLAPFFGIDRVEKLNALFADRERVARIAERLRDH